MYLDEHFLIQDIDRIRHRITETSNPSEARLLDQELREKLNELRRLRADQRRIR